jgi:hypothetical protein
MKHAGVGILNLQAADSVLEQQGYASVVCRRASVEEVTNYLRPEETFTGVSSSSSSRLLQQGAFDRRVVQEPQVVALLVNLLFKEGLSKVKPESNSAHHGDMKFVTCL